MTEQIVPFDRRLLRRRRDRAVATLPGADFLFAEIAGRLADRLNDFDRRFARALDLGCHTGQLARALAGRGKVTTLVQADLSPAMAAAAGGLALAADEEAQPFAAGAFDLVLSALSLHWANDLPGALVQARRALKPDGLFLAALFGGETLGELRQAWLDAEADAEGGAGPHVAPFADLADGAALLQRAGFALPVADLDTITVSYASPLALMAELRAMGEASVLALRRRRPTRRATLAAAVARYAAAHGDVAGRIPATFQVIYLTGWAPHPDQQQALRPGSAAARLADALDAVEQPTGEPTGPDRG